MNFAPTLHKLSNGVSVILDPMDVETAVMNIHIKGGTRIEQPHEYGISHFIEHMLFKGTKKYPIVNQERDLLMDNGGVRTGGTNPDRTQYYGRILREKFPLLLDILSEIVLNPVLSREYVEKERGTIIQELKRSQDDQTRQFGGVVKKALFAGSYLEKYDGLGTIETIGSFSAADLADYRNAKYTANNIIIGISGKFGDSEKILSELETRFGAVPCGEDIVVNPGRLHPSIVYDVREDKKQTRFLIGFESLYPFERAYDYENMCLGAFSFALVSRLHKIVRDKGLAYDFGASGAGDRHLSVDGFGGALSPERLREMIAAIASASYDILHGNPITLEELNRHKMMKKLRRADFLESVVRRRDKLVDFYATEGDLYDPAKIDAMRERITPGDVMKYSCGVFGKPLSIIAQGPKCDIDLRAAWEDNFK